MKMSETIKPISYLKSHASEIARGIAKTGETLIITPKKQDSRGVQFLSRTSTCKGGHSPRACRC